MAATKKVPKVLIVDDEPALLDIYSTKLGMEGFEVMTAQNGVEALAAVRESLPDLILLDIIMPVKDGFETLEDLKSAERTKHVPVIVLSNLGQDYEVKRGMSLGAKAFLTKANLSPQRVAEEVRKALNP